METWGLPLKGQAWENGGSSLYGSAAPAWEWRLGQTQAKESWREMWRTMEKKG